MSPVVLRAPRLAALPGVHHGFSTRREDGEGGARVGFDAGARGRDPAAVRRDRERLAAALGAEGFAVLTVGQVHGREICDVVEHPGGGWQPPAGYDALVTGVPGVLLGILTADCLPVLIADPVRRVVAAAHAGWRSTALGIVASVVERLVAGGSDPADLHAALGPAITIERFEVGEEVVEALAPWAPPERDRWLVQRAGARPHVDLHAVNRHTLERAGVAPSRIEVVAGCTVSEPERFHSYRRDGERSGRQLSLIGIAP